LIGDDDEEIAFLLQAAQGIDHARQKGEVFPAVDVAAILVEDAIAVEKGGGSSAHAAPHRPSPQPFEELEHGDRVFFAQAGADEGVEPLRGGGRQGRGNAAAVGFVEHDAHVFLVHPGLETGAEVALEHAGTVVSSTRE